MFFTIYNLFSYLSLELLYTEDKWRSYSIVQSHPAKKKINGLLTGKNGGRDMSWRAKKINAVREQLCGWKVADKAQIPSVIHCMCYQHLLSTMTLRCEFLLYRILCVQPLKWNKTHVWNQAVQIPWKYCKRRTHKKKKNDSKWE